MIYYRRVLMRDFYRFKPSERLSQPSRRKDEKASGKTKPINENARRGTRRESKRPWRDGKALAFRACLAKAGIQRP